MYDNKPVFPVPAGTPHAGIAYRDWLAAMAMQGLASRELQVNADRALTMKEKDEQLAARAYALADAMLTVRRRNAKSTAAELT